MAKRGDGYGSEDHLNRYWTDHRAVLEARLLQALGRPDARIEWIYPSPIDTTAREPEGLDFLPVESTEDVEGWKEFWPQSGTQQCWDGVARLLDGDGSEWLLIEAKANHAEFCTPRLNTASKS
jgi:hypothetical protein